MVSLLARENSNPPRTEKPGVKVNMSVLAKRCCFTSNIFAMVNTLCPILHTPLLLTSSWLFSPYLQMIEHLLFSERLIKKETGMINFIAVRGSKFLKVREIFLAGRLCLVTGSAQFEDIAHLHNENEYVEVGRNIHDKEANRSSRNQPGHSGTRSGIFPGHPAIHLFH